MTGMMIISGVEESRRREEERCARWNVECKLPLQLPLASSSMYDSPTLSLGPPLALHPPFSNRRKLSRYPLPFFGPLLSRSLIVDGDRRRRRRCVRNGSPHLVNRSWTRASPRARDRRFSPTLISVRPRERPTISAQIPSLTIYGLTRAFFLLLLSPPLLPASPITLHLAASQLHLVNDSAGFLLASLAHPAHPADRRTDTPFLH